MAKSVVVQAVEKYVHMCAYRAVLYFLTNSVYRTKGNAFNKDWYTDLTNNLSCNCVDVMYCTDIVHVQQAKIGKQV